MVKYYFNLEWRVGPEPPFWIEFDSLDKARAFAIQMLRMEKDTGYNRFNSTIRTKKSINYESAIGVVTWANKKIIGKDGTSRKVEGWEYTDTVRGIEYTLNRDGTIKSRIGYT